MKRFKRIYIEITNKCNLSCSFCAKTSRKISFLQIADMEKILLSIKDYTDNVYFHVMGEPLLNENLSDFFLLCEKYNIKVNLTTNGTLLNVKSDILENAKALRKLAISIHSFESDSFLQLKEYLDSCITAVN